MTLTKQKATQAYCSENDYAAHGTLPFRLVAMLFMALQSAVSWGQKLTFSLRRCAPK